MDSGTTSYSIASKVILGSLIVCYAFSSQANKEKKDLSTQTSKDTSAQHESLQPPSPEIQALISQALEIPAEFSADALLRIARSIKISAKVRRDLIENAFNVATRAQYPLRLVTAGTVANTREGFLTYVYAMGLDSLSLQCRAVREMLAIDTARARDMFLTIPFPQLPPLKCQDVLVYDVSDFYSTLNAVLERAFTKDEVERGDRVYLVDHYIQEMSSPVQVAPLAKTVAVMQASPSQLAYLVEEFTKRLAFVRPDDRAFSYGVGNLIGSSLGGLPYACKRQGVPADGLVEGLRSYLISQHHSSQCADNVKAFAAAQSMLPDYIKVFNGHVRLLGVSDRKEVSSITMDELKPTQVEAIEPRTAFWQSPKSLKLLARLRELRFGSGEKELSTAEKSTLGWRDKLYAYLNELNDWQVVDETDPSAYFHQKCTAFGNLLITVPEGELYYEVLRKYVAYLSSSLSLMEGRRIEWFFYVDQLLIRGHSLRGEEAKKYWDIVDRSNEPILKLNMVLARLRSGDNVKTASQP